MQRPDDSDSARPPDEILEADAVTDEPGSPDEPEAAAPHLAPASIDGDADQGVALMRIIDNAVTSAQPIEVIERLLAVHERLEANEARRQYNAAISALRADLPDVVKTELVDYPSKKAGRVSYMHENLARMVEDLSPVMAPHGLSFRWRIEQPSRELVRVTCIVTHAAGHSEETMLEGPPDVSGNKNAIQAIASTVSYLQRYTLKSAIGLAAGKDDDGAGGAPARPAGPDQAPIQQPRSSNGAGDAPNGAAPGDSAAIDELHQARSLFPAGSDKTITKNQQGRLRNLARKAGWTNAGVDAALARELSCKASEIPSTGDAYDAIVRWFQAHPPADSGGAS